MIFFRTVLNRTIWSNPLSNLFDGWWIYEENNGGNVVIVTDCLQNIILFTPFSFLLLWFMNKKFKKESIGELTKKNIKYTMCLTLCIEFLQLFLCVGTFQISDLVYNMLGGIIGSLSYLIYFLFSRTLNKK